MRLECDSVAMSKRGGPGRALYEASDARHWSIFAIMSFMPDLRLRGARTPATPIARALFFFIGCLLIFQAARLLFLCN